MRGFAMALAFLACTASAAGAQQGRALTARLEVPEVLVLRVDSTSGTSGAGTERVRLLVSANRGWRLVAVSGGGAAAEAWPRVRVLSGPAGPLAAVESDLVEVSSEPVEMARGGAGRAIEVVVEEVRAAGASAPRPVYTLERD